MKHRSPRFACLAIFLLATTINQSLVPGESPSLDPILDSLPGDGGIIAHLGCGDGTRSLSLHDQGRFVVQSLDRDASKIAAARQHIQAQRAYGEVSVNLLDGSSLPYAENLINVLVVDDPLGISRQEMLRVLRPLGTAWLANADGEAGQGWEQITKPWPNGMDDWTHFLHDASGNAVSKDKQVGPPSRLQWTGGPLWTRSHEFNNSMPAMVSAKGRVFYIFDYGLTGMEDQRLPEKWTLLARDAFNGSLLWKRDMSTWGSDKWQSRALRFFRGNVARRLVADGDRVFVTFDYGKGVEILDAATGQSLGQVPDTEGSEEILVEGNQLICISQANARRSDAQVVITCYDIEAGKNVWQYRGKGHYTPQLTCVADNALVYHAVGKTICLNLFDGSVRWTVGAKKGKGAKADMLVIAGEKLLVATVKQLSALSMEDGQPIWTASREANKGSMREYDMFVAQGKVFINAAGRLIAGYDLESGEKTAEIDPAEVQSEGHHLRCYRAKATENYLITQFRGVEFLSLDDQVPHNQNDWLRGSCTYGVMPANGFLYQPPHSCFCFAGAMQKGFNAFAAPASKEFDSLEDQQVVDDPGPIEEGPAYGDVGPATPDELSWNCYRHDQRRTGATASRVEGKLERRWTASLGTAITPPVAADGRLFVVAKSRHTIHAFDGRTGEQAWTFVAGGPIDSSPSIHRGRLLFGCADGYAYCIRAEDGALAWRRRLAPGVRWMADNGALESVWRLHGSPTVVGELAYLIAGRSSFVDGGLFLSAIDIKTGEIKHRANLFTASDQREDRKRNEFVASYHIEGAHSDLLVAQDGYIYLNQMKLSPDLKLQPTPYLSKQEITARPSMNLDDQDFVNDNIFKVKWRNNTYQTYDQLAGILVDEKQTVGERKMGLHMLTTSGFLDSSFFNRTYWMYAETWPGFNMTNLAPKSGQLLVVGPKKTYALKAFTERYPLSPSYTPGSKGYLIVADDNHNEPTMDPRAWGKDKGMGFSRGAPPIWHHWVPVRVNAMVLGGDRLYLCGPPDVIKEDDPMAAFEGRLGSELWSLSAETGEIVSQAKLEEMPIFDGMIVADKRLYLCTKDGDVICMGGN